MPFDTRPEGVYISSFTYPYPPAIGGVKMLKIERVNGDASVDHVMLDPEEVERLKEYLHNQGD